MLKNILAILLVSCYFLCNIPSALAADNACSASSSYLVVHINGINTSHENAVKNAIMLANSLNGKHNGEGIAVILAENKTNSFWADIEDVFKQKINEYPNVASSLIFKALVGGVLNPALSQPLKDFITNYHVNKIKNSGFVNYSDNDLQDIVGAIRAKIIEGQKVLLVPHSQGNLYANAAYNVLTTGDNAIPTSAIKIMGIASPAAYVAGGGDYVTSENDLVISGLRELGLNVLAANLVISRTTDNILGHSMTEIYLNSSYEGRAKILQKIYASMDSLYLPGIAAGQGPISVALTWGSQPDVDLHVFEPDGAHVSYLDKQGGVGYLDVDDTASFGPEHYYTDCVNLQTGTYTVGVNYFYGNAPEIASVTISTPVSIVTRTLDLAYSNGSSGNSSPAQVGKIKITRTSSGRYSYEIL